MTHSQCPAVMKDTCDKLTEYSHWSFVIGVKVAYNNFYAGDLRQTSSSQCCWHCRNTFQTTGLTKKAWHQTFSMWDMGFSQIWVNRQICQNSNWLKMVKMTLLIHQLVNWLRMLDSTWKMVEESKFYESQHKPEQPSRLYQSASYTNYCSSRSSQFDES